LVNIGMALQHFLDLARIYVRSSPDDEILGAVLQREISMLVENADVARVQPTAAKSIASGRRIVPVAPHDGRSAADDLAFLAGRTRSIFLIVDGDLHEAERPPHRTQPLQP